MKTSARHIFTVLLLFGAIALIAPQGALALGTAACTNIANTASIEYSVGSVTQTALSTGPSATFRVGSKVNMTVVTTNVSPVQVAPGAAGTNAILQFTVTNDGNAVQGYSLSTIAGGATATSPFAPYTDTDNFDATAVQIWVATGGGAYANASTISALASDTTASVQIRANTIPTTGAGSANNDFAVYALKAVTVIPTTTTVVTAATGTGTVYDAAGASLCTNVDVVFADSDTDGAGTDDGNRDAAALAKSAYKVQSVTLNVSKTATTISDPFGGTTTIPGSIVEYKIRVTRTGGGTNTATGVVITDTVPGTTAPVDNQYTATGEVRRVTYNNTGAVTTTTDLVNGTDADLLQWATTTGATVQAACNFTFDETNDYCEIQFRVQVQ